MSDTFDLRKFLTENKLTRASRGILENTGTISDSYYSDYQINLGLLLEGKRVQDRALTQGLIAEHKIINKLLEENVNEDIQRYITDKLISPVEKFFTAARNSITNITKNIANSIIKGIKVIFSILKRFMEKYPRLSKAIVCLLLIILLMVTVGAVSAYASAGGDLSDLQQLATTTEAGPILDALYGLITEMQTSLSSDYGLSAVIETKALIMDLKDGVVDIPDFSNQAKALGDALLGFFEETMADAKLGDKSALNSIGNWVESGKELINNTVLKLSKVTVNPDGSVVPRIR